ncbi:hypothetical protein DPMN_136091 [Dreissena polymorpha]|uniref:Uncharacterized protein n=1 Tax=Dreissena polymorpha TaxID=45954 RepID=A0A9D4FZC0_DREPO|nr:hypothetical protein DPMN_136091 [Dreissena polymorpha]
MWTTFTLLTIWLFSLTSNNRCRTIPTILADSSARLGLTYNRKKARCCRPTHQTTHQS